MLFGEQALLAVLVALVAGIGLGRLWSRFGAIRGREGGPRHRPSIHYLRGLDLLASRQMDGALVELTHAARENTEATEIYLVLGNLLREKGQLERAIQIHQSILHRPGISASERAQALLSLGTDFKRAGFRNRAIEAFSRVVEIEPGNTHARKSLIKIYEEEQEWKLALDASEELAALTNEPHTEVRAFLHDQIGQAALAAGDEAAAAREFETSIRLAPKLPPAYLHHGDLLEASGKLSEAEARWFELTRESPRYAHLVFERLARVRDRLVRSERMEDLYHDVMRREEGDWRAHVALARLRRQQGRIDEAFDLLLEAASHNPHAIGVHLELWKLLAKGEQNAGRIARYFERVEASAFFVDPHVCVKCSYRANGVLWRCPHCQEWHTFVEERVERR